MQSLQGEPERRKRVGSRAGPRGIEEISLLFRKGGLLKYAFKEKRFYPIEQILVV